jgi:hypothetical protein
MNAVKTNYNMNKPPLKARTLKYDLKLSNNAANQKSPSFRGDLEGAITLTTK